MIQESLFYLKSTMIKQFRKSHPKCISYLLMATVKRQWQSRDDLNSWLIRVLKNRLKSLWLTSSMQGRQLKLLISDLSGLMLKMYHGHLDSIKTNLK